MPIGAIIGGIGSIVGGMSAADGAREQAAAQRHAADLQHQQFEQIQNNMRPFMEGGTEAFDALLGRFGMGPNAGGPGGGSFLTSIGDTMGGPPPSPENQGPTNAAAGWNMRAAPNPGDPGLRDRFQHSPGYGYLIDSMTDAVQNSAAGRTGAISGNMLTSLQRNAGGIADQDWWNFYNADVSSWGNNVGNWWNVYNGINQNYQQRYQDQANNRNQMISALGSFGASGQNAAANLGGFGQAAATSMGNAAIGAANANAAGRVASTNAFTGGASQIGNAISSMMGGNNNGGGGPLAFLQGSNNSGGGYGGNNFPGAYASPSDFSGGFNPGSSYAYPYDPGASAAGFGYA